MTGKRGNGEGTIYRHRNKWRAMVLVSGGKRMTKVFDSKVLCQEWIRTSLAQLDNGLTIKGVRTPYGVFLEDWLKLHENTWKLRTRVDYRNYIEKDVLPALGKYKMKELNRPLINNFFHKLVNDDRGVYAINYIHRIIRSSLNFAISQGLITYNPAVKATLPRLDVKTIEVSNRPLPFINGQIIGNNPIVVFNFEQIQTFLTGIQSSRYYVLYLLALVSGMREGELLGLTIDHIEFFNNSCNVHVAQQVQKIQNHGDSFSSPKSNAGFRTIQIPEFVTEKIRFQIENVNSMKNSCQNRAQKLNIPSKWDDINILFPSIVGTPLGIPNIRKDFKKILKQYGLPDIRFHDLRHTTASILINDGVPIPQVSYILGHRDSTVTLRTYTHLIPTDQQQYREVMDSILAPPIPLEKFIVSQNNREVVLIDKE